MSMVLSFKVVVRLRMVKFSYNFETLTILLIKSMSIRQASTSCLIRVGSHTQNRYVVFDCSVHHATYRRVSRVCIFKSQDPKRLKIDTTTYQRMATSFIVRVRTSWCTVQSIYRQCFDQVQFVFDSKKIEEHTHTHTHAHRWTSTILSRFET